MLPDLLRDDEFLPGDRQIAPVSKTTGWTSGGQMEEIEINQEPAL